MLGKAGPIGSDLARNDDDWVVLLISPLEDGDEHRFNFYEIHTLGYTVSNTALRSSISLAFRGRLFISVMQPLILK